MTATFGHGLVVGKFYPPHRGHLYLIGRAAALCARVTVLVMAAGSETVPLADRVAWLRAAARACPAVTVAGVRCDVPVDFGSETIWAAQVAVMRTALEGNGRPPVDAVFSSEPYGDELAARFGAEHVCVDPSRSTVPVSASQIRADLAGCWDDLLAPARAGLAARVVVVGRGVDRHVDDRASRWRSSTGAAGACGRAPGASPRPAGTTRSPSGSRPAPRPRQQDARSAAGGAGVDAQRTSTRWRPRRRGGRTRPRLSGRRCWSATPTRSPPRCGSAVTWARRARGLQPWATHGPAPPRRVPADQRMRACRGMTTGCARETWRSAPR